MTALFRTQQASENAGYFPIGPSSSAILEAVRVNELVARADLPPLTGLSQQTVHRLTEDLLEKQLLQRCEPVIQGRGKPSPRLAVNPSGAFGFGVSVDTNSVEAVWIDLVGQILSKSRIDVSPNDPEAVIAAAYETATSQRKALNIDPVRVAGCGVSTQGFRITRENLFTTPLPLNKWTGFAIEKRVSEVFGCPAHAENNATLGAIAELWSGAGKTYPTFAYLSFNHGFGGGLVIEGKPFYGFNKNAAELTTSFPAEERADRPALQYLITELRENGVDVPSIDVLKSNFDPQWPGVRDWVQRVTPALNRIVGNIYAILDPAAIVYGGEAPPALREMLINATSIGEPDRFGRNIPGPVLIQSQIPAEPSAVGAGIQAIRRQVLNQA
ncbi:putative NBD/HSP70 family sugar kinase [Labrenzia sp. EL_208]|uniref:ROK family protein n=1 Tax=Roseibium album TaxID=311410 RepID=UPI00131A56B2|nr:ROK family protein [Roseibium album]MBG6144238.1 putative NBD/HSP70 family sugar kinase [Labrenzia sp. EL_142]MBG6157284.1 putative NBD/HSP70 family sugar kinase [Labrenzia sp. EL_162]MBG6162645.1 putative NBD/HSP70 family sugar kinase [Labrenzia sp. EL_195]MBG6177835.1 putative NBD/HSP70 family sugar kinase [Labrenzia sp. EL_132]MBG6196322.1 putative NBD/HSP70 family sugar kinase [Labrenzia sp. EL_159]MBG6207750.1 putative NBD/HSP70 family sugar kinase [Labrenzia sp. EL_126]MBG6232431.1 